MEKNKKDFLSVIKEGSQEKAAVFITDFLQNKDAGELYKNILIPSMKSVRIDYEKGLTSEWENNLINEILKTVIELTYPYILKQKSNSLNKKVLVASPYGEEEQVGALIAKNISTLVGFDTFYLGANLKEKEILKAIEFFKPDYYMLGLKNFYNTFETRELLNKVVKLMPNIKIIVGGPVLKKESVQKLLKFDYFVRDYSEIYQIAKEVQGETSAKNSN